MEHAFADKVLAACKTKGRFISGFPRLQLPRFLEKKELSAGRYEIIEDVETFKYPIKIVVAVENDIITVVSSYPLKKGRKP